MEAVWRFQGTTAVIEMARASGLSLVGGSDANDALAASTRGTGELISAAVAAGARRIIVGLGGSATTDGGLGAVEAIFPVARLSGVDLIVAVDVMTAFTEAAREFAPQKGATPSQVDLLTRRLERLAQLYQERYSVDVSDLAGAGAAGGLAGGLVAIGGRIVSGFELVADELDLLGAIERADLVVTGEGLLDPASFDGKVVGGVVQMAEEVGVPVLVVAGEVADGVGDRVDVVDLVDKFGRDRAMSDPEGCVRQAVTDRLG